MSDLVKYSGDFKAFSLSLIQRDSKKTPQRSYEYQSYLKPFQRKRMKYGTI